MFLPSPVSDEPPVLDVKLDEKANSSSVSLADNPKPAWGAELPSQVSCWSTAGDLAN